MSTPSAKTATSAGAKTTKMTTTVVKTVTTTTKQVQPKSFSTLGAGSKVKKAKTLANGKKVVNSHSNRKLNANGLMRFSRGRMFHRRALYRIDKWKGDQAKLQGDKTKKTTGSIQKKKKQRTPALKKKPLGGDRNGKERLVRSKRMVRCWNPSACSVERKSFFLAALLSNGSATKEVLRETKTIRRSPTSFPIIAHARHRCHPRCWQTRRKGN